MQITNTVQTPSFGMAMRIQRSAGSELRKLAPEVLDNIRNAAERLKNTKCYHVELTEGLKCKVISPKTAYFGVFEGDKFKEVKQGKLENILLLSPGNPGNKGACGIAKYDYYGNPELAQYSLWGSCKHEYDTVHDIGAIADIVLELDKAAAKKAEKLYTQVQEKNTVQQTVDTKVATLLNEFGV